MSKIPAHVAIIMDGNGRWAQAQGLPRIRGHEEGGKRVREIVRAAGEAGVKYLTLYAFSSENWKRPKVEIDFLMNLLSRYLESEKEELQKMNVQFQAMGELNKLSNTIQKKIGEMTQDLSKNTGLVLTLALSYSSRNEITQAVRRISEEAKNGKLKPDSITDEVFSKYLYTKSMPDPDLLIRTSGEYRISNFLLWQLSYTELYITDVFWPDFKKEQFLKALEEYGKRERRYGLTESAC